MVKQQLDVKGQQEEGDWGGEIGMIEVSAHTGQGIDELVERIQLEAEILELDAKPDATGEAIVVESKPCSKNRRRAVCAIVSRIRSFFLCRYDLTSVMPSILDPMTQGAN